MLIATMTCGICAACQHGPDCVYCQGIDYVPLQCEQFELAVQHRTATPVSTRAVTELERMVGLHSQEDPAQLRSMGLCANCDHRTDCVYSRPEGGVWRCEEYE